MADARFSAARSGCKQRVPALSMPLAPVLVALAAVGAAAAATAGLVWYASQAAEDGVAVPAHADRNDSAEPSSTLY